VLYINNSTGRTVEAYQYDGEFTEDQPDWLVKAIDIQLIDIVETFPGRFCMSTTGKNGEAEEVRPGDYLVKVGAHTRVIRQKDFERSFGKFVGNSNK